MTEPERLRALLASVRRERNATTSRDHRIKLDRTIETIEETLARVQP